MGANHVLDDSSFKALSHVLETQLGSAKMLASLLRSQAAEAGFNNASDKLYAIQDLLAQAQELLDGAQEGIEEGITVNSEITAKLV